jgi:DNA-binding Lrp family transcriptional regulator
MNKKNGLSRTERLVLDALEMNARLPLTRVGTGIRKSQQIVSYTLNSLVERGVIHNFFTLVDYANLGVLNFRVYFRVNYTSKEKFDELIDYLKNDPHSAWIVTCSGRYDLICSFFAKNPSDFNKTLRSVVEKFPRQLQNYSVLTTIVVRKFGRKYLLRGKREIPETILGGDVNVMEVDEMNLRILDILSEQARTSVLGIARELSVTARTVIERIRKMERDGIIKGYRFLLDTRKTGHVPGLLMIRYHNITSDSEDGLLRYLKAHPNVRSVARTLGEWDLEISTEARDPVERRSIEMEIRQKFTKLIQNSESIPLFSTHKKIFFPKFLVKK